MCFCMVCIISNGFEHYEVHVLLLYSSWRFEDLKANFLLLLNGMLYYLCQNNEEYFNFE